MHRFAFHVWLFNTVIFMGRHQLQPSLKWMGAFWLSIAGKWGSLLDGKSVTCMQFSGYSSSVNALADMRHSQQHMPLMLQELEGLHLLVLIEEKSMCSATQINAGTIATFQPFSPLAAALVAPTQLWVTIAAKLNYDIVQLNKSSNSKRKPEKAS